MRRAGMGVLAVVYGATSVAVAAFVALIAEFHCDVDCRESGSDWTMAQDAWQWEAIAWLGLFSVLTGWVTLVLALRSQRPLFPVVGLGFQGAMLVPVVGLLLESNDFSPVQSVFCLAIVLLPGGALIYLRNSRQRAGTRRE